ncbi:MAG: class I SAM-dependent methyltransferase [Candidatus Dormibacteria bacterium]
MNRSHATLCSSARWAAHIKERFITPLSARANLGDTMLEIGPGPGAATEQLRQLVDHLTVLEVNKAAAARLARRYREGNVEVVVGSASTIPFQDESFSSVASFTMLHHVPTVAQQDRILLETFRVLRPGGVLLGSDSLASAGLHAFHQGDTYNPVEPATFFTRLRMAGFARIVIEVGDDLVFLAVKGGRGRRVAAARAATKSRAAR